MCKRLIAVMSILLLILLVPFKAAEAANSGIKLSIETGMDGKVKSGYGFPSKVTVKNDGKDFKGDLLINFYPSYNSAGAKAIRIDLPAGSTKTYRISIPGMSEDQSFNPQNMKSIHLYEGSWEKDNEVEYAGPKNLMIKYIDPMSKSVGLLSEDPDRIKELRVLSSGNKYETLNLNEKSIPEDSTGMKMLDFLVIDEFAISALNKKQQSAISEWISTGGILIAGASPDAAQSYGNLYPLLPMKASGETVVSSSVFKEKPDFPSFPVLTGSVEKKAKVLIQNEGTPIVISKDYGSGQIIQTAFSLGDAPVAAWKGYGDWFTELLMKTESGKIQNQNFQNPYDPLYFEFAESNEYFKSIQFSVGQLALILLFYMLVLVPILYFLLRKLDKREHAWWVIPLIAVASSSIIFGVGARDRLGASKINQMGVFKAENGRLEGIQAITLLSNRGGNYKFSIKDGKFEGVPVSQSQHVEAQRFAVLKDIRNGNEMAFPDVEYWSTRTSFGGASKTEKNQMASRLKFEGEKLTGEIKNNFPYDFDELYIWSGSKKIKLGSVKSGETLTVNKSIKQAYLSAPRGFNNSYNYQSTVQSNLKIKKERLGNAAVNFLYNPTRADQQPILFGYTKNSILKVKLEDRRSIQNNVFLIFQPVKISGKITGPFTLENDMLNMKLNPIKGNILEEMPGSINEILIDDGDYEYTGAVPVQFMNGKSNIKELSLSTKGENIEYFLFDHNAKKYTALETSKSYFQFDEEEAMKYVSKEGTVTLKLIKSANGEPHVILPAIKVKGEIKP